MDAGMKNRLYISMSELTEATGKSRRTVYSWLRRKAIVPEGHSVSLLELHEKWPEIYGSLMLRMGVPLCPECSSPTKCECSVCDWAM